jgi:uncharacterized protein
MDIDQTHRPVLPSERIVALDVIRGFAMLGVLLAYCAWSLGAAPVESWSPLDRALETGMSFAVDGKLYTLLAFLFGLGFQLQLGRAEADERTVARLYRRRLLVLAGIGLVHALLLRNGDILLPYAITGLLLVPFRQASDRTAFVAACAALLVALFARWAWPASGWPMPERPAAGQPYLVENLQWVGYWYSTFIFTWPINLTLFLVGFVAGRNGWIATLSRERKRALQLLGVGLAAAVLFDAARRWLAARMGAGGDFAMMPLATLLFTFHCWGMASAYAAALLLALRTAAGRALLAPLAAVGRMALTNYLMQAALIVPLCLAFGWFDTFTPLRALLLTALVFPFQALFSMAWLRRFDFGPAEWFWRLLTYGRPPAARRSADAEASL